MSYQTQYYDDFTSEKNFRRVLFRPARPVQTRELNQLQRIQQNQSKLFSDHMFKHGALLSSGRHIEEFRSNYIVLDTGIDISLIDKENVIAICGDVVANVIKVVPAINNDPDTVYLLYTQGGPFEYEDEVSFYIDDELVETATIKSYDPDVDTLNPIGMGILWTIPEATYYLRDFFVEVESTIIVGDKYGSGIDSYTIGLDIVEWYVSSDEDQTLLDNAINSKNYQSEGADRLKVVGYPTKRTVDSVDGESFVILAKVENGVTTYLKTRTDYGKFMDMVAERTYDESGHYSIIPFTTSVLETEEDGVFDLKISAGKAYIAGYLLEKIAESTFTVDLNESGSLPRVDSITIDKFGGFNHIKGVPADLPRPPKIHNESTEMEILRLHITPPVTGKESIRPEFIDNRRYTMRDIGRLENRIENMEYYTTFTVLEMKAEETSVTDELGYDRFKNGFLADNFQNFQAAGISDPEFRASLAVSDKTLHPQFGMFHSGVELDTSLSENCILLDNFAIIDYDHELFLDQPFATKHISTNPYFIFNKSGKVILDPAYDNWGDVSKKPAIVQDIVLAPTISSNVPNDAVKWGAWNNVTIQANNLGTRVTDVGLKTWMRSIPVKFYAGGLKPNTRLYVFFDDVNVTEHCRPAGAGSKYGDPISTDADGKVSGEFLIPDGKFFVGQKTFRLTNCSDNSRDVDMLFTDAEGIFWSGGLDLSKQETILNVITPILPKPPEPPAPPCFTLMLDYFNHYNIPDPWHNNAAYKALSSVEQNRLLAATNGYFANGITTALVEAWAARFKSGIPSPVWCNNKILDPVAQSFTSEDSCFITKVDLFFQQTSKADEIFVWIVTMENGYPTKKILGEARMAGANIEVSTNASVSTTITFPFPIYIEANKDYAIVVGSSTPEPRVFISKIGDKDLTTGAELETQPTLGSFFKSQNASTWDASQYEDLKFRLYRARFKHQKAKFVLKNKAYYDDMLQVNPFETQVGKKRIRVRFPNHAMRIGDKFKPRIAEDTWIETIPNKQFTIGWRFKTSTGQGIITNILSGTETVSIKLKHIKGYFLKDQSFVAEPVDPPPSTNYLISTHLGITQSEDNFTSEDLVQGYVATDFNMTLNGIPFDELNNELTVVAVDSAHSFIVETTTAANLTGFTGGNVLVDSNRRYDMANISGSYLAYGSNEKWTLTPRGYAMNGLFENQDYQYLSPINISLSTDISLEQPAKLANTLNQAKSLGNKPSFLITAEFQTPNTLISPVISTDTFSFIGVSNTVDYDIKETYEVVPNATNRFIAETDKQEGVATYKYITQEVVLANTALDLKIMVDVHKPQDSDFDFYLKALAPWNSTDIDDIPWTKIEGVWKDFTCERDVYREVFVLVGDKMPTLFGTTGFGTFKVKIVGRAKNPTKPPLFRALRVIAVT